VGHFTLKEPLPSILSFNKHNYNPIKGSMEFRLYSLPNSVLFVFRYGIEMGKQQESRSKICQEKHDFGFGLSEYWGDILLGWFG
jgi:hypothetical protein